MSSSDVSAKIEERALSSITAVFRQAAVAHITDFYGQRMPAGGVINDQERCMEIVRKALEEMAGVTIEVAP